MNQTITPDDTAAVGVVGAMLQQLAPLQLAELEYALALLLFPLATASERRLRDLGFLAELQRELPKAPGGRGFVRRERYDELRERDRPDAPSSERLVHHYGNGLWRMVCRKASGLLPDGRYAGISRPIPTRFTYLIVPYRREEVWAAINRCALERGHVPSSHTYKTWADTKKRLLRERGMEERIPVMTTVYTLYPELPGDRRGDRWARALRDARVSEQTIREARLTRLLGDGAAAAENAALPTTPAEAFEAIPQDRFAAIGIDEELAAQIAEWGFHWLPLSTAARIAHALGGSLEWLAGIDSDRRQPADPAASFDIDALVEAAERAKKQMKQLRLTAKVDAAAWTKLTNGKREPRLAELYALARVVGVDAVALLRVGG